MVLRLFFALLLLSLAACSERNNPWDPNGTSYSRALCGEDEYNPNDGGVSCNDGVLYSRCDEQWYNSSSERCNNNMVEKQCGNSWYNEESQQCVNGVVKNKIILDENFENGLFEWSTLGGLNLWTSGSAAGTRDNSSNAAYISSDGTNYNYISTYGNRDGSSEALLYRKIVFPPSSSNFSFTFDWKCNGHRSANMSVYLVPVSESISTSPDATYRIGKSGNGYFGQSTWTAESITLSAETYSGKRYNLIFYWYNTYNSSVSMSCYNGCSSTGAAAIDNVVVK